MTKRKKKGNWVKNSPGWMVSGCLNKHSKSEFQAYLDRGITRAASPVRRIDPLTGEVIAVDLIEAEADRILKADQKRPNKPSRKRLKATKAFKQSKPSSDTKAAFYLSWEWRTLRMEVLKTFGRTCQCCGATPKDKTPTGGRVRIVVDHIKPVSRYWHLRLDGKNLQVLCEECNQGKGNWDETDYRIAAHEPGDELTAEYREIMRENVIPFPASAA